MSLLLASLYLSLESLFFVLSDILFLLEIEQFSFLGLVDAPFFTE